MSVFVLFGRDCVTGLLPLYLQVPSGERLPPDAKGFDAVLQWGVPSEESAALFVLNPVKCLLRARHPRSVRELWRLNGLKTAEQEERWVHQYQVAVFQQEALGVWAKINHPALVPAGMAPERKRPAKRGAGRDEDWAGFRELPPDEQGSYHVRRAKRDAVRAVYALGLSTGLVRLGVDRSGATVVIAADPAPRLGERLAELYAAAINQYAAGLAEAERGEPYGSRRSGKSGHAGEELLLGADPEFVLRRPGGGFVSASRFLEKEGRVGSDAVVLSRSRVIHPLAELRPKPTPDPKELVRELYRIMRQGAKRITDPSLEWLAGSMPGKGLPIGGHVHISGIWLNDDLLRVLDNYVALPLVLAEGEAAGSRRPRYGFLGDCRRKRHGGFEYRPLPSWLATPELALGVLALVKAVALHYRELRGRPLYGADVQKAYYNGDKEELLPVARKLWPDLERTAAYWEHRAELDAFRDRLFRLEGWDEQADIRKPWKIPPFHEKGATPSSFVL